MIGIVEFFPNLSNPPQQGDLIVGNLQLQAGKNEVDVDKWNAIADLPLIKARIEQGVLRPTFAAPTIIIPVESQQSTRRATRTASTEATAIADPVIESIPETSVPRPEIFPTISTSPTSTASTSEKKK